MAPSGSSNFQAVAVDGGLTSDVPRTQSVISRTKIPADVAVENLVSKRSREEFKGGKKQAKNDKRAWFNNILCIAEPLVSEEEGEMTNDERCNLPWPYCSPPMSPIKGESR